MNAQPLQHQQRVRCKERIIVSAPAGGIASPPAALFAITNVDPRLWIKIVVALYSGPGDTFLYSLVEREYIGGIAVNVANRVGTTAAPLTCPTDTGLFGHSVQLQTGANELGGVITWPGAVAAFAQVKLTVEFWAKDPIPEDQWTAIRAAINDCVTVTPVIR